MLILSRLQKILTKLDENTKQNAQKSTKKAQNWMRTRNKMHKKADKKHKTG
jgi:hypothetical protein